MLQNCLGFCKRLPFTKPLLFCPSHYISLYLDAYLIRWILIGFLGHLHRVHMCIFVCRQWKSHLIIGWPAYCLIFVVVSVVFDRSIEKRDPFRTNALSRSRFGVKPNPEIGGPSETYIFNWSQCCLLWTGNEMWLMLTVNSLVPRWHNIADINDKSFPFSSLQNSRCPFVLLILLPYY